MKKVLSLLIVALIVSTTGFVVFADDGDVLPDWFKDMIEWRKGQLNQAVEDGVITEEQAEYWTEHYEDMEEYHKENGFGNGYGYGGPGGCHGGNGRGPRRGYGPGMMNNGSWNNNYQQNQ